MRIPEISTPGLVIDWPDPQGGWDIEEQLSHMRGCLFEAAIALDYFESPPRGSGGLMSQEKWFAENERRRQISLEIEAQLGPGTSHEHFETVRWETEIRFKHEKWAAGYLPREFEIKSAFLHAKAFLYAVDEFRRFLLALTSMIGAPTSVASILDDMDSEFPHLRGVRNTTQHLDERAQGLGPQGRPLHLQPVSTRSINAPAGVLVLSHLDGNRFGCTMANGEYGEVEVSGKSLIALQHLLDRTIKCYPWKGPRQHFPS